MIQSNMPSKVLLVDDDQTLLMLFSTALRRDKYDVETAGDGRTALAKLEERAADVVLLDINLPDMSGIEVMRQIVKSSAASVILITGDDGRYSHATAVQEGATDFIVKPIRLAELGQRVRQALEMRRLAEAQERLVADLERLAIRDELTGLFNYRHFQARLKQEAERAQRYRRPFSLIVFDADHFKEVNDTLGHAEGDRVLAELARILGQAVRGTDVVCRYGGEEFAVLLPETPVAQAAAVAERARQAVEAAKLLSGRPMTVSAGAAEVRPDERGEDLVRRVDAALYAAKRAGRNRVELAS